MAANGEIGTLEPIAAIGKVTRARGVPFHVDAVGAGGRVPLAVDEARIDLLTLSSNDLYGPPGAGALWMRPEIKLAPLILGGGQEGGYRAGTENLPAIVGMGVAADLVRLEGPAEVARLRELRDRLLPGLLERLPEARLTGARGGRRLPHHSAFVVAGGKGGLQAGTRADLRDRRRARRVRHPRQDRSARRLGRPDRRRGPARGDRGAGRRVLRGVSRRARDDPGRREGDPDHARDPRARSRAERPPRCGRGPADRQHRGGRAAQASPHRAPPAPPPWRGPLRPPPSPVACQHRP